MIVRNRDGEREREKGRKEEGIKKRKAGYPSPNLLLCASSLRSPVLVFHPFLSEMIDICNLEYLTYLLFSSPSSPSPFSIFHSSFFMLYSGVVGRTGAGKRC